MVRCSSPVGGAAGRQGQAGEKKMKADKTADMWAGGVTVYEMTTDCSGGNGRRKKSGPYLQPGTVRKVKQMPYIGADGQEHVGEEITDHITDHGRIYGFLKDRKDEGTGEWVRGGRLHIFDECPPELRVLMEALWVWEPESLGATRPSANQCILFLTRGCELLRAPEWAISDGNESEFSTNVKEWIVDDLGVDVPNPDVFQKFDFDMLVDDDERRDEMAEDMGAEFTLSQEFKAMGREIKALEEDLAR